MMTRPRSAAKKPKIDVHDECLNISTSDIRHNGSIIEHPGNFRPSFGVGAIHRGSTDVIQLHPSRAAAPEEKSRNQAVTLLKQLVANT